MARAGDAENELASRLALFDDEPDINDWFEVALGAAMITMGLHQLFNPGGLFETGVMQWLGAAVVAMGILLALFFADLAFGAVGGLGGEIIGEMGIRSHFDDFERGVIDTKHIVYFVSVIVFFLFLSVRALESRRWR